MANLTQPAPPAGFSELLEDEWAIAAYVEEISSEDVDSGLIREMFRGCRARLVWVELASLKLEDGDHHIASRTKQRKYDRMAQKTTPPLLVDLATLRDGYHRLRALQKRGATHWWAYVVEETAE